jgi:DNA-binding CsgD family transcriptional regulator
MVLAHEQLIGRSDELALLDEVLIGAMQGEARFAFVSGEAGIGKSRLIQEVATSADDRGFLVLEGSAAEFELELPFGIFTDALDAYLRTLDEGAIDRLATDSRGELAAVFPALGGLVDAVEQPISATERFRVYFAVRDLLERLAVRHPLALFLDDAHWTDSASLELLQLLVRRPPEAGVAVVLAARSAHGDPKALEVNRVLQGADGVMSVELGPLRRDDVECMLGGTHGVDVAALHEHSGGNPFYALELVEMHRSGLVLEEEAPSAGNVPDAVSRAIGIELDELSSTARACIDAAAVLGDPFDVDLVAAVSGTGDAVWVSIDDLLAKDLVRTTGVPRRYRFRHPLVRSAVYLACKASTRFGYHRSAAHVLTARGAPATATAVHLEQAAEHGDLVAVAILREAGRKVANHAPVAAAGWFAAALRLLPASSPAGDRVGLLTSLADAEAVTGRFPQAHNTLEQAIELAAGFNDESRVSLIVRCSEIDQLLGHHNEARARLQHAYDELVEVDSAVAVSLLISLCSASLYLAEHEAMLEWGGLAVEAAERIGDEALIAAALAAYTAGAAFAGRIDVATELHDRATRIVDALADEAIVPRLDALTNLTTAELYLDRHVQGCDHGERALALARTSGQTQLLPILTPILGTSLAMAGEMRQSADVLDDAIEAARLAGNAQGLCLNLFNRALTAVVVGDLDTALGAGAESVELARSVDNGVITAFAGAILSQAMLEEGDAAGALELLLESVGGEEIPLLAGGWRAHFFELLARIYLRLGYFDLAAATVGRVRHLADEIGLDLPGLMADRAGAALALADARAQDAMVLSLSAVKRSERIGACAHAATSHALAGRALSAAGHREEAIAHLERAADGFDAMGATRYRDQAETELRSLGATVPRRVRRGDGSGAGVGSLTGREREVADLVVDRRTNREIAEALFLSTKTVESHLRNVFHKLAVSSRVEVARVLEQNARPPSHVP